MISFVDEADYIMNTLSPCGHSANAEPHQATKLVLLVFTAVSGLLLAALCCRECTEQLDRYSLAVLCGSTH